MGYMKNKAILMNSIEKPNKPIVKAKVNRIVEVTLQQIKNDELTAEQEDYIIESQLEQIREDRL